MKITLKEKTVNTIRWEDVKTGNLFVIGTGEKSLAYKFDRDNYIMMTYESGINWGESIVYAGANIHEDIPDQFRIDKWEY